MKALSLHRTSTSLNQLHISIHAIKQEFEFQLYVWKLQLAKLYIHVFQSMQSHSQTLLQLHTCTHISTCACGKKVLECTYEPHQRLMQKEHICHSRAAFIHCGLQVMRFMRSGYFPGSVYPFPLASGLIHGRIWERDQQSHQVAVLTSVCGCLST